MTGLRIPLAPDAIRGIVAVMIELSEVIANLRSELDTARVVELGTDGKISSSSTQRIKLILNPRLTEAAAAADTTALAERSAFVHGTEVGGER